MPWFDDPKHPFAGIWQKLKRADENIVNLDGEISAFFEGCEYPVIPDPNSQEWRQVVDYHEQLAIPIRFAVLTGEIVHHLRSCFDHMVWHFSSDSYRRTDENAIEFPIFCDEPIKQNDLKRYERKVGGIAKAPVQKLIKDSQPYHRGSMAADDPLCIIHNMDRFDKHRELTIVMNRAGINFPAGTPIEVIQAVLKKGEGELLSASEVAAAKRAMENNPKITPTVALAQFGNRKSEALIPAICQLFKFTAELVDRFSIEV